MQKVELSLALSSRGRLILRTSLEEHLISLSKELLSTRIGRRPGTHSVSLGKIWASDGVGRTAISVILNLRVEPRLSPDKQLAIGQAFS